MTLIFHRFFFTRIRFLEIPLIYIIHTINDTSKCLIRDLNLISKSEKKLSYLKSNKIPADSVAVMIPLIPAQFSFPFLDDFRRRTSLAHSSSSLFSPFDSRLSISLFYFPPPFPFIFPLVAHGVCSRRVTTPLERAARKIFLRRDSHFSRLTVVEGREITVAHLYGICSLPARRALPRSLSRWVAEE